MLGQHASYLRCPAPAIRRLDPRLAAAARGRRADGARLSSPKRGRIGTRMVAHRERPRRRSRSTCARLRATRVEPPNAHAGSYISDGPGQCPDHGGADGAHAKLPARWAPGSDYHYRTAGSRDWRRFGSFDSATDEGMIPLAVDPAINAAYVLRKLNGRFALYRVKLDGIDGDRARLCQRAGRRRRRRPGRAAARA